MKYTVELDSSTKEGSAVLKYLRKLDDNKAVSIHKWKKLTAADVALPGGITPTEWQWNEYLDRKEGKGKSGEKAFAEIRKKLKDKFGK
jgi:hypothetical protein